MRYLWAEHFYTIRLLSGKGKMPSKCANSAGFFSQSLANGRAKRVFVEKLHEFS
jgi:hypothetical protein